MGRPLRKKFFGALATAGNQISLTADLGAGNVTAWVLEQKGVGKFKATDGTDTAIVKLQATAPAAPGQARCELALVGDAATSAVTFNATTNAATWTAHGLVAGDAVIFTNSGGALPVELTSGTTYYVSVTTANTFTVAATNGGTAIDLAGVGTGTHTATRTNKAYAKTIHTNDVKSFDGRTFKWTFATPVAGEAKLPNA